VPLITGHAISYSPLLYRPLAQWPIVRSFLVGQVTQPVSEREETPERLAAYAQRIDAAFERVILELQAAAIETLVVLVSDRHRIFDETNTPQLHVFAGEEIWGDPALAKLGEAPQRHTLRTDAATGRLLADELAHVGFDVAETRDGFRPAGDAERGAGAPLIEPVSRLRERLTALQIVPVHVNAFVDPCIDGSRMHAFGIALARALALSERRCGVLASGGLSGDPGGYMAGWIDETLDRWVLSRLSTGRSAELGSLFAMESVTLRGSTREIRLWAAAGAALESLGARGHVVDYLPFHHAAVGTAFMHWGG
jgi:hypothetical protein